MRYWGHRELNLTFSLDFTSFIQSNPFQDYDKGPFIKLVGNPFAEITNQARAPWWMFFKKKSKMQFKCFKKNLNKILDADNFEIHNPAKSQFKIRCV
jgi:hypothetical protein